MCQGFLAAAAAVVVIALEAAAATATAAVAEQEHQNDDPPPVVVQAAAQTVVVTAHKNTSEKEFIRASPLIPWYSPDGKNVRPIPACRKNSAIANQFAFQRFPQTVWDPTLTLRMTVPSKFVTEYVSAPGYRPGL